MKETIIAVSWQSVAPRGRYWYYKMSVVVSVVCLPPDCQLVEPGAWCILLTFWSGVIVIISHHHHNNIISSTLTRNYEPRIIRNNLLINSRPDSETPGPHLPTRRRKIIPSHLTHPRHSEKLGRNVGLLLTELWLWLGLSVTTSRQDQLVISLSTLTAYSPATPPISSQLQAWYLHIY